MLCMPRSIHHREGVFPGFRQSVESVEIWAFPGDSLGAIQYAVPRTVSSPSDGEKCCFRRKAEKRSAEYQNPGLLEFKAKGQRSVRIYKSCAVRSTNHVRLFKLKLKLV